MTDEATPPDNCTAVFNPSQADRDGAFVQEWAYAATASSEYTSGDYAAMQATGAPQSAGMCQDMPMNWSPLAPTAAPERLELRDSANAYHVVWSDPDATTCGDTLQARWPQTP